MTPSLRDLEGVDAVVDLKPWAFTETHRDEIAAFWAKTHAAQPRLFDGEILLQHDWGIEGGIYRARYTIVRYSAFLAWRAFGHPGAPMRNGFGMAALRAADGAFLLGRMAAHTANPGMIYFAAGTPDRGDIVDGRVDLAGSVRRELQEETGLRAEEFVIEPRWTWWRTASGLPSCGRQGCTCPPMRRGCSCFRAWPNWRMMS